MSNIVQVRSNGLYLSAWPALQCADRRLDAVLLFLTLNTIRHHTHILPLHTHTNTHRHTHSTVSSYIPSHMYYINTQTLACMSIHKSKRTLTQTQQHIIYLFIHIHVPATHGTCSHRNMYAHIHEQHVL